MQRIVVPLVSPMQGHMGERMRSFALLGEITEDLKEGVEHLSWDLNFSSCWASEEHSRLREQTPTGNVRRHSSIAETCSLEMRRNGRLEAGQTGCHQILGVSCDQSRVLDRQEQAPRSTTITWMAGCRDGDRWPQGQVWKKWPEHFYQLGFILPEHTRVEKTMHWTRSRFISPLHKILWR